MPVDTVTAKSVFLAALEKPTPTERATFLDQACAGDSALRERVEALLTAHDSGSFPDFLADAAANFDATLSVAATPNDATKTNDGTTPGDGISLGFLSPPREPGNLGRLDHYEVQSVLGQGGMGIVLKALDESLDRIVAIKVLGAQYAANGTARRRFIREAKAVAAVVHEHVVNVHAVDERVPYLVMQYVKGVSLQDRIDRSGPLELKEILRIGMQIALGLAAAHAQGIVHRDIKPSNILLENGIERVKLTDFGLARAVDDASVTQSGVIAGTPMYMSPEQARGESVDRRSDLFSLGSVLYAMCAGHAPFRASGTMAVMKRVIEDSPRSIREQNADIPEWLEAIVFKLLAKKPAERFQSAKELASLLEQHLAHLQQPSVVAMPARVAPARPRASIPTRPKKHGWTVVAVVSVVLILLCVPVLLIGGLFFLWSMGPSDKPTSHQTGPILVDNEPTHPNLVLEIKDKGLRVVVVSERGEPFTSPLDELRMALRLAPGRYHVRTYRGTKPEVLVFQQWVMIEGRGLTSFIPVESGWTQLFNGEDLRGWKVFPADRKMWTVKDGILTGKGMPSHLFSERGDLTNFHLRMETRVSKGGACGQFARVPFGDPGISLSPFGDEELYKANVPELYAKNAKPIDPPPPTYRPNALTVWGIGKKGEAWTRKIPENEWFVQELIFDGKHNTVKLTGFKNYSAGWQGNPEDGYIALQLFDSDSVVEYRKIEIKELPTPSGDENRLQGTWRAVEGQFGGVKLSAEDLNIFRATFTGDHFRAALPPKFLIGEGTFSVNSTTTPGQITLRTSTENNQTFEGIYTFDGARLVLCFSKDSRPKGFSTQVGASNCLLVLEHEGELPPAKSDQRK